MHLAQQMDLIQTREAKDHTRVYLAVVEEFVLQTNHSEDSTGPVPQKDLRISEVIKAEKGGNESNIGASASFIAEDGKTCHRRVDNRPKTRKTGHQFFELSWRNHQVLFREQVHTGS